MNLHTEFKFENEICEHLSSHGWLFDADAAADYHRELALFPSDVVAWVQETQPDSWNALTKKNGSNAVQTLVERLRTSIDQTGTLDVLRNGFDVLGLRSKLKMAQFKPALAMNPEISRRYDANRLRVIRQVHYSKHNEKSIDLVLFLNGIPVATVELKTEFTQSVEDAVDQYRFDRLPKAKGQDAEPLLAFPNGALVHFAVSNNEVRMTTKLAGPATYFLPFNKGNAGAAGNPQNPDGFNTAYLWEGVWRRDSWLDILGRYMIAERDGKKKIKTLIFPRYHQLDATRDLLSTVLDEGPGKKYLIQHSAGSGKTKSIAWTVHFLSDLHDENDKKMFDSVIVVSDRNVIDGQLSEAIEEMERNKGVVANIKAGSGSKSSKLTEALAGDKKIIVCTIQTFPFALEAVRELAATQNKKFAVIADEAHSSQSGTAAAKLKTVLSDDEILELEDGGEVSAEDILAAEMASRASEGGITYIAFTATPKSKTLEIFGRRPSPDLPAGESNLPEPFHVYSMQQAIEEGFILDVLQNFTTYSLALKLAQQGREIDDEMVDRSDAMKSLMRWVRLHPHNIAQKVITVVEHFRETIAHLLDGKAKAMVVVGSRIEAVRWQLALSKYIAEKGYAIRSLVAFSGEVVDRESGPDNFRETSESLNPGMKSKDVSEEFKASYQILIVANKFQTGFDQPLLCGMYVDKKLAGIQAVQTLSRLNRAYPEKDKTYVLDFVNKADEVLEAFKMYYQTATLAGVTDPNIILNLRTKLDSSGYYDIHEVERVVNVELDPNAKQSQLDAAIGPVADRLLKAFNKAKLEKVEAKLHKDPKLESAAKEKMDALILFRSDLVTYQRAYTFLSQIFDYGNTDFEKRAIFFKYLLKLLKFGRERDGVDLSGIVLTHHRLRNKGTQDMRLRDEEYPQLRPFEEAGTGEVHEKEVALLNEIIERVNELFTGELTDGDKLIYVNEVIKGKLLESAQLRKQAENNTKKQFIDSPDLSSEILDAIMVAGGAHQKMSKQALDSEEIREGIKKILLGPARLYETLREGLAREKNL